MNKLKITFYKCVKYQYIANQQLTNEINAVMIVISCNATIAVSLICLNLLTAIK